MDNSHNEEIIRQEKVNTEAFKQECTLVTMYGLVPLKDGDHWCYLLGDNLQDGIAGFGKTPYKAMIDFNKSFHTELSLPPADKEYLECACGADISNRCNFCQDCGAVVPSLSEKIKESE